MQRQKPVQYARRNELRVKAWPTLRSLRNDGLAQESFAWQPMHNQAEFSFDSAASGRAHAVSDKASRSNSKAFIARSARASLQVNSSLGGTRHNQGEFSLDSKASDRGYVRWLAGRRVAAEALARRIGLPLGHEVEVWLLGGVRLRGKLRLAEELMFIEADRVRHLELVVDKVPFAYREMESCVRLD